MKQGKQQYYETGKSGSSSVMYKRYKKNKFHSFQCHFSLPISDTKFKGTVFCLAIQIQLCKDIQPQTNQTYTRK